MNTTNSIIPVSSGADGIQTVNARDLHAFLESGQEFRHWIKSRIEQYGFVDGQDFTTSENFIRGGKAVDYHITLDMAKELSMVERNAKGKEARQYFIECERVAAAPRPPVALPASVAAAHIKAELELAALFGVPLHLAQVEAVKTVKADTGYDASRFLLLAPAQTDIPQDEMRLEPTELGKKFGMSAVAINKLLEAAELQKKVDGSWEPTGEGKLYASSHQWKVGNKSGYNLKWNVSRVRRLVESSRMKV